MTAVTAARWDIEWDRGGGWWRRIGRRTRTSDVLTLAAPCTLEIRPVDAPSTTPPVLTVVGALDEPGAYFDLTVTRAQIEALPRDRYEHRILVTDAVRDVPLVLLRGYVAIRDTVGGD